MDFHKTFSSTAQIRTFRFVTAVAFELGLAATQYDISNAFLNGPIDADIYMKHPPGYPSKEAGTCFKLLKGLYGLKQASRIWQQTLYSALGELGLEVCKTESGVLHTTTPSGKRCWMLCWVDDLIIYTDDEAYRKRLVDHLMSKFIVKSLGKLAHYVGIVVKTGDGPDGKFTTMDQAPYNRRSVHKFLGPDPKESSVPGNPNARLSKLDSPYTDEEREKIDYPYMSATGTLLYTALCTRPDIFFSVAQLCRFNSDPGEKHVQASKQVFQYLARTGEQGIRFTKTPDFDGKIRIIGYVDSDWGGCVDTRRSTAGYVIHVANGPVSWVSKLMKTMALSSCEAEFMGMSQICREIMWMCRFLDEIGVPYHTPEIHCDSASALTWSEDPVQHQRNKHVEIKYYYVRDCVANGSVIAIKVCTTFNFSDIMTKCVGKQINDRLVPSALGHLGPRLHERKVR